MASEASNRLRSRSGPSLFTSNRTTHRFGTPGSANRSDSCRRRLRTAGARARDGGYPRTVKMPVPIRPHRLGVNPTRARDQQRTEGVRCTGSRLTEGRMNGAPRVRTRSRRERGNLRADVDRQDRIVDPGGARRGSHHLGNTCRRRCTTVGEVRRQSSRSSMSLGRGWRRTSGSAARLEESLQPTSDEGRQS